MAEIIRFQPCTAPGFLDRNPASLPIGLPSYCCVYRSVTKKKVASNKRRVATGSRKKSLKKDPLLKEAAVLAEELEDILSELRTSTVRYSRQRIEKIVTRLKALGEQ